MPVAGGSSHTVSCTKVPAGGVHLKELTATTIVAAALQTGSWLVCHSIVPSRGESRPSGVSVSTDEPRPQQASLTAPSAKPETRKAPPSSTEPEASGPMSTVAPTQMLEPSMVRGISK